MSPVLYANAITHLVAGYQAALKDLADQNQLLRAEIAELKQAAPEAKKVSEGTSEHGE